MVAMATLRLNFNLSRNNIAIYGHYSELCNGSSVVRYFTL